MRLDYSFYHRDCVTVARELVGKLLTVNNNGTVEQLRILETEAYFGENDTACHAHKGRTKRSETLYMDAGTIYVYLCYGKHYLLNIITGAIDEPEGVLIRACDGAMGPGRLTKKLGVNMTHNRGNAVSGNMLWIEDDGFTCGIQAAERVGIGYASKEDQERKWRFIARINE